MREAVIVSTARTPIGKDPGAVRGARESLSLAVDPPETVVENDSDRSRGFPLSGPGDPRTLAFRQGRGSVWWPRTG